jgi:hypothetical protein
MSRKETFKELVKLKGEGLLNFTLNFTAQAATKLSYPFIGLLPARCQEWAEDKLGVDPATATLTSSIIEGLGCAGLFLYYGGVKEFEDMFLTSISLYGALEGFLRTVFALEGGVGGSLPVKIATYPFALVYDYFHEEE